MDFQKDYYKTLNINHDASKEEIRSAYRKLVRQYHPDKNPNNPEFNEIIKEINEAYSVLTDNDQKVIYDEFIKNKTTQENNINEENKRKYKIKKTVRQDLKFYLKGKIFIKYTGDQDLILTKNILNETYYNIYITDVEIIINEKNIISKDLFTKDFEDKGEIFRPIINNVIKAKIISENGSVEYYDLNLHELKVTNPTIKDVTKQDGITCGTIYGDFTGYILKENYIEIEEEVTEYFGETGLTETKFDDEGHPEFIRNEYFHSNGTKYWGPWIQIKKTNSPKNKGWKPNKPYTTHSNGCLNPFGFQNNTGCITSFLSIFYWFWIFTFLFKISPIICLIILIAFLISFIGVNRNIYFSNFIRPFLRFLFYGFLITFLLSIILSLFSKSNKYTWNKDENKNYTKITESRSSSTKKDNDFLISHNIKWKSLNNDTFNVTLSVLNSEITNSQSLHHNMSFKLTRESDFTFIYKNLFNNDFSRMDRIYSSYDSLISKYKLDKRSAAEMIVSSIQAVPYSTVLESSCENDNLTNRFPTYSNNTNNCVGFEKYGVRSPIEFLKDLKGDCDTRSLFLYSILKKFNYDVVILTSTEYQHALIAINLNEQNPSEGKNILINNKQYFLWETTSYGWKPGVISNEISNLKYWNLSLLN